MRSPTAIAPVLLAWLLLPAAGCRTTLAPLPPSAELVDLRGNEALSRADLLEVIRDHLVDYERSGYGKASIDDAAFLLEQHYRDAGYASAVVDYSFRAGGRRGAVRFLIEEGARVGLASFEIEGVASLDRETILALATRRLAPSGLSGSYFSAAAVDAAVDDIRGYYRSSGFLDARVVDEVGLDAGAVSATVTIRIEEGPRYLLRAVTFSGEPAVPVAELERLMEANLGSPYTPRVGTVLVGRVVDLLEERGHPDANADVVDTTVTPGGDVALRLRIRAGPRVRIRNVELRGHEKTNDEVIRNRVALRAGDVYRAGAVRETFDRLYRTGLFREIRVRLEPEEGEERDLVIEVVELESIELFVEPGFGSYELARVRAGIRNRNLFGTGRILRAEGNLSNLAQGVEVGLTDPWFLGSDTVADAALVYERREEPSFEFEEFGTDLALIRSWSKPFSTRLGYRFRRSDLIQDDVDQIDDAKEDFDVSSVELSAALDRRDSFLQPSRGFKSQASIELANGVLGSQIEFLRGSIGHSHYFGLRDGTVLAARLRTGVVAPIGKTDAIPIQERYFNGGESSVRSFEESELGPVDAQGDPTGGEAFSLASVELRQVLAGRLEGALFVDAGNVAPDHADYFDFADLRYAVGAGLRYQLPVGPLRVDIGVNPDPQGNEEDFVVHFSLGQAF